MITFRITTAQFQVLSLKFTESGWHHQFHDKSGMVEITATADQALRIKAVINS